ncbi:MAG: arginine--tRNA ligase [Candidatus Nanohaloarchaea archaeon]
MKKIKKQLAEALSETLGVDVSVKDIERPDGEHGDFAYPAMKAASQLEENPRKLAEGSAEALEELDYITAVDVAGPGYLNFHLDRSFYAEEVCETLESENMGVEERSGKALVEFSSPNIAKPMHIGHLRNNVLGDSIQRILRFVGEDVTSENYVGDLGTQFGKLIYAHKNIETEKSFDENPMEYMYDLYVKFHEVAEENPEVEDKGREWASKIEEGDEEARELWRKFREASLEYHKEEYERLGISFDRITGESTVLEGAQELIQQKLDEGVLGKDDDGSVFLEFEDKDLPGVVLLKTDGSTLYITRDLYNIKKRKEEDFDEILYVVASEQELNFRQLFAASEKLGISSEGAEHISYGLLSLPEGSMSSRKGRIAREAELLDAAVEKASERMEEREGDPEAVGIGAVKYANLSVSRRKDIEFDWDEVLTFEGDSGPYLQYSNTRAKSILKKSELDGELKGDLNDQEYRLLKKLSEFPEKVDSAAEHREPAKIANYLSQLCEEFNSFYHSSPVLGEDETVEKKRLKLVEIFVDVTDHGLELLGIQPLEEM